MSQEEQKKQEQEEELSDIEIAELANKEIKARDAEIAKLKKDLAKAKLLSQDEGDEPQIMSKEDCFKILGSDNECAYDVARAVVDLYDNCIEEGNENPMVVEYGQEVRDFFEDCLNECGDNKSKFIAVYQAKLGEDDPQVAIARRRR